MNLLRLIPQYRSLLAERDKLAADLEDCASRRVDLEDELRESRAKHVETLEALAESRRREVTAVQTVADWIAQFTFGRRVFTQAPDLPEVESPTATVSPSRPQARQEVDELTRKFEEMYEASGIR